MAFKDLQAGLGHRIRLSALSFFELAESLLQVGKRILQEGSVPRVRTRFQLLQHSPPGETEAFFFAEDGCFFPAHLEPARARRFARFRLLRFY